MFPPSQGTEGVSEVISLLDAYDLTREDWDSIVELAHFKGRPDILPLIPSKVGVREQEGGGVVEGVPVGACHSKVFALQSAPPPPLLGIY